MIEDIELQNAKRNLVEALRIVSKFSNIEKDTEKTSQVPFQEYSEDRIKNPLREKDMKWRERHEKGLNKILRGTEILSTMGGLFQDIIKPFAVQPIAQAIKAGDLKQFGNEVVKSLGVELDSGLNPLSEKVQIIENDIASIKERLSIRNLLNMLLTNIQVYVTQSENKPEVLQKIFFRIHEILNENFDKTITIIKREVKLPALTTIKEGKIDNTDTLIFSFQCPNCQQDSDFVILQSTEAVLNNIREMLGITSVPNTDTLSYAVNIEDLNEYQFAFLYTQLVNIEPELKDNNVPEVIDNLLTRFNKESIEAKKCKSCNKTLPSQP